MTPNCIKMLQTNDFVNLPVALVKFDDADTAIQARLDINGKSIEWGNNAVCDKLRAHFCGGEEFSGA